MTRNHAIHAVVALAFSASPLFAQDNPPNPPPPGAGSAQREGHQRSRPQPTVGIFALLDANHDGGIDQTELSRAGEILRKLDRDADGRITPKEMLPGGQGRDGGARTRHRGPGDQGKRSEGSRDPAPRPEGATNQGPRSEGHGDRQRPEGSRRDGERPPSQGSEARRDGERAPGRASEGPRDGERAEKPSRDGDREHGPRPEAHGDRRGPSESVRNAGPQPPARGESDARREGPKGPPPSGPTQAQTPQRHGFPGSPGGDRFGQNVPRPDFGRDNRRTPWAHPMQRGDGAPRGPFAMGPQMGGERAMKWQQAMRERMEQRGIRPDPGFRGPQGGPGQYLPPQPGGGDRRMPARMGRPDSGPQSDRPRGPGDFHSPEGRREGGQQRPPMEERGPRPPGSGQRDVQ